MKILPFILLAGIGIILFFFFSRKVQADTSQVIPSNDASQSFLGGGQTLVSVAQKGLAAGLGTVSLPGVGTVSAFPVFGAVAAGSYIIDKKLPSALATAVNPVVELPLKTGLATIDTVKQISNEVRSSPAKSSAIYTNPVLGGVSASIKFASNLFTRVFGSSSNIGKGIENVVHKLSFGLF